MNLEAFDQWVDDQPGETIPWETLCAHLSLPEKQTFGRYLWAHRTGETWTATETARRLGMSKQLFSDYEKGRKIPSIEQTIRICTTLEMATPLALKLVLEEQISRAGLERYEVAVRLKTA